MEPRDKFKQYQKSCPKDVDLYTWIIHKSLHIPIEEVTEKQRQKAKILYYTWAYSNPKPFPR